VRAGQIAQRTGDARATAGVAASSLWERACLWYERSSLFFRCSQQAVYSIRDRPVSLRRSTGCRCVRRKTICFVPLWTVRLQAPVFIGRPRGGKQRFAIVTRASG
jgi:hypothetical protein